MNQLRVLMAYIREAAWFAVGCVFLVSLIPPALIVASIALGAGYLERE